MKTIKKLPTSLVLFIWHYVKEFKWVYISMLFFKIMVGLSDILFPYVTKLILEVVQNYSGDLQNIWQPIEKYVWISIGAAAFGLIVHRIARLIEAYNMPAVVGRVKLDLFSYIQNHSHKFFSDNFAGAIASKFNDMAQVIRRISSQVMEIIAAVITLLFMAGIFLEMKWWFSAWFLTWVIIHFIAIIINIPTWNKVAKDAGEARSKTTGKVVDTITNNTNVKMFSAKNYEYKNLEDQINDEIKIVRRSHLVPQKTILFQTVLMLIMIDVGLLLLQIYSLANGYITIADFAFIFLALAPIGNIVFYMTFNLAEFMYEYGTGKQALKTISVKHSVTDIDNAKVLNIHDASICIDNVSFCYNSGRNVFDDLSLVIPAGQKVGVVGHSGAGKSTLSQLLLRYYDIDKGNIYIGGEDIALVSQDSLRSVITMVPQDTSLFHRTIMENIKYGNPSATDEEVYEATKKAKAHEFILTLSEGYNSMVGERGIKLSVGQRQRIAIARAILKNAPIVIMDEATSALDSETEVLIQDSMENLMQGKTALVIAHRLSTLKSMDRLIVMEGGKIIEDGSHQELVDKKGVYHKLYTMQQGGFIKT